MQCIALPQPPVDAQLRRLCDSHRADIEKHLLDLDLVSRNRRFHCGFGDAAVTAYVHGLDLDAGVVVGAVERDTGRIVGLGEAHPSDVPSMVEVGASVLPAHRGRGLGQQLVAYAVAVAFEEGMTAARLWFDPTDPVVTRVVARLGARTYAPGQAMLQAGPRGDPPQA